LKKKIAIVGGGACALILACELDPEKFDVSVFEGNPALGRKFLVAGEGGLNLTHSENESDFILRYTPFSFLKNAFSNFSNNDFVKWINGVGIKTYVGSSRRVFPERGVKPIEVLNAILKKAERRSKLYLKHRLIDFSMQGHLVFEIEKVKKEISTDLVIFCLGGASWPVTGSTGEWAALFKTKGIKINPFLSSNCSFEIHWPETIKTKIEGKILKNISITCENKTHFGEVVLTRFGIEGSGIYPLSPQIRSQLANQKSAKIHVDFKPGLSLEKIIEKLGKKPQSKNMTEYLKTEIKLSDTQMLVLKEFVSKKDYMNVEKLANTVKKVELVISATGPLEDAISTVGGVDLSEIDQYFQLKKFPTNFVIGEMLDYDAPTGGYLLQSCFSMGKYLADHLNSHTI